jgi:mRNA-decapping enzyme subunit 2
MSEVEPAIVYTQEEVDKAFEEALDDVHTRFILNLPPEELASTNRIFFQLEQAWWFYDDFICDGSDLPLPRFKGVKPFALKIFQTSPVLSPLLPEFSKYWEEFSKYKRTISTYGTILMNQDCTKVVLCQVWNSSTWMFPAGKVNQNEHGCDAGARETYEETGFDPQCKLGKTRDMFQQSQHTWKTPLDPNDALVFIDSGKRRTLFVCRGVPEDFPFEPVARKEVSAVEWHDLDDLPKKSFAVFPFVSQLKRWIRQNTGNKKSKKGTTPKRRPKTSNTCTTPNKKRSTSSKKSRSRNNSRGKVRHDDLLAETGLAAPGEENGWTEDAMFQANERLLGRKVTYDGNPHLFAEKGFNGMDPHAFHVVGGSFMNSGIAKLAPAPDQSKLQPLFRQENGTDEAGLQPFFSDGGETPWGEVITDAGITDSTPKRKRSKAKQKTEEQSTPEAAGQALLKILQKGGPPAEESTVEPESNLASSEGLDALFMTDKEITAKSQEQKSQSKSVAKVSQQQPTSKANANSSLQEWAQSLPPVPATKTFGDFHFDVDAIRNAMNNLKVNS